MALVPVLRQPICKYKVFINPSCCSAAAGSLPLARDQRRCRFPVESAFPQTSSLTENGDADRDDRTQSRHMDALVSGIRPGTGNRTAVCAFVEGAESDLAGHPAE